MVDLVEKILLAGRNNNYEILLNILFVVVMAVFWLVGTIMKSKVKDSDDDTNKPRKKTSTTSVSIGKAFWEQFIELSKNQQLNQKRRVHAEKNIYPVKPHFPDKIKPKEIEAVHQSKLPQTAHDFIVEPSLSLSTSQVNSKLPESPKEQSDSSFLPGDISLDYSDPDEVKRAIIYKEILDTPVSMRDLSES